MSKGKDKKRKMERRRLQKQKSSLMQGVIDDERIEFQSAKIPEDTTILKDSVHDGDPYSISFLHYIKKECELDTIVQNKDRDAGYALCILKEIGFFPDNFEKFRSTFGYTIKVVNNGGEYRNLYNSMQSKGVDIRDTSIHEAYIKGRNDGRMFFWVFHSKRTIYVLTIRKSHYK